MTENRSIFSRIYAFAGFILGLGAPLGWLALRFALTQRHLLGLWLRVEVVQYSAFYSYLTVSTALVFTVFGYFIGRRSDAIKVLSDAAHDSAQRFSNLAMTDALTGVPNARHLHEQLAIEMESAIRHSSPLACVMIDIDNFKTINDTFGHPMGDTVLVELARVIRQCVRRIDMMGRLGGEEFLVIMPHTPPKNAYIVAERMRLAVERLRFPSKEKEFSVTISLGLAAYPSGGVSSKSSLMKLADEALYDAKRTGKNKTVFSSNKADVVQESIH